MIIQDCGGCGGYFTATANDTDITSPCYPDYYEVDQYCYFIIVATVPHGIVRLNFYHIDMEPNQDFLQVYL